MFKSINEEDITYVHGCEIVEMSPWDLLWKLRKYITVSVIKKRLIKIANNNISTVKENMSEERKSKYTSKNTYLFLQTRTKQ